VFRLQVGERRHVRRRLATLVAVVAAMAVVLVPAASADNGAQPTELFSVSGSLKCGGTDPTVCAKIPGTPGTQQQLGGAEFRLWLYRSLDGTRTWGNSNVRFAVHTPGEQGWLDDPATGPHPGATIQTNTYTSWYIAPSPRIPCLPHTDGCAPLSPAPGAPWGRKSFWVNGTACLSGNFVEDTCHALVNQPTNLMSDPGHYTWDNLIAWIAGPAPTGVSVNINVTENIVDTVAP